MDTRFKKGQPSPLKGFTKETHPGVARAAESKRGKKRPDIAGPLNQNWKGGVTSEAMKARHSQAYREWRSQVFKRDDYTCQRCHQRGRKLEAHHIKPFATHPELRFDVENGITLCYWCHRGLPDKPHYTRRFSEEHRQKLSEAAKLRFTRPDQRQRQSENAKRMSAETRAKIAESKKGKPSWNKGLTKNTSPSIARMAEANRSRMVGKRGAESLVWHRWHPEDF